MHAEIDLTLSFVFFFVLAKRADTLELCPVQGIVRRTIFDESYLAYAYIAHCMWEATKKRKPQKNSSTLFSCW